MPNPPIEQIIKEFDIFIKKWCGNNYSHLIDNDENDGERFRQIIYESFQQLSDTKDKECEEKIRDQIDKDIKIVSGLLNKDPSDISEILENVAIRHVMRYMDTQLTNQK